MFIDENDDYDIEGYGADWQFDRPVTQFIKLKALRITNNTFNRKLFEEIYGVNEKYESKKSIS